ncbi:hypothetical protein MNB_SV-13-1582 [hydrothermal vent metagenome]|uniref:Uncharacterized protein n=1 Tax=hydrothermal vent metagenome TaxID=652676 RepID=A0A1W1BTD6_9ZZZZ
MFCGLKYILVFSIDTLLYKTACIARLYERLLSASLLLCRRFSRLNFIKRVIKKYLGNNNG